MEREERLQKCGELLNIIFKDTSLLEEGLTHSSADQRGISNERMEFLGDSILGLVVTEYIYQKYPHYNEGRLTKIKSAVVSRQTLAEVTSQLGVAQFCLFGQGIRKKGIPTSVLANVFEAVVAAIYLDQGYGTAQSFILNLLGDIIELQDNGQYTEDYKSLLQDFCQKNFNLTPTYKLISSNGPEHSKVFAMAVSLGNRLFGEGQGTSKKKAEQQAARTTLADFKQKCPSPEELRPLEPAPHPPSFLGKLHRWWRKKLPIFFP